MFMIYLHCALRQFISSAFDCRCKIKQVIGVDASRQRCFNESIFFREMYPLSNTNS